MDRGCRQNDQEARIMVHQIPIQLKAKIRGFHLITDELIKHLPVLPETGLLNLFIQHTSAGISINENSDPDVLLDFESVFNKLVPENLTFLKHTMEGPDDMPAHIKSTLTGCSITIPIQNHRLALGTWQGIYLCEFRNQGGARKLLASLYQ